MLRRLTVTLFRTRRACSETTNDSLWSMSGLRSGPHHLRKQVNIVISLTRHLFANRVQDFQKSWATIHVLSIQYRTYETYRTYITLSVASDTKNSGVTIIGT